jgi:hypothetical protein
MRQTPEAVQQNLAERLCWQVAGRDDSRVARRLYRKQVVDGVYQLDEGALLDDFFYFLHELGAVDWLRDVQGTAVQREMVPFVQYIWLYSLKTLLGIERRNALPALLCSDEALMRLVGFNARLQQVVFDRGFWDGVDLWWLAQHGIRFVVPAKDNMAVTVDARAQAAAGEGLTVGRRVHTVRHGQGKTAWTARLETEVVGIAGLTTDDQYGPPEHGRHHHRRDFQPNPINAVVVRKWNNRNYGPGGKTVFLTNAAVDKPLQPFDDADDRSLIEHGCIKESQQPWSLQHPPQKTARAVRGHVMFTLLMFALATAYRLQCEQADVGGEPIGWQRWRRQLLEQTRDHVIVFAGVY